MEHEKLLSEKNNEEAVSRSRDTGCGETDVFCQVEESKRDNIFLGEYFKKKERIYIPGKWRSDFFEKLFANKKILIKGAAGSGKTTAALTLAEEFSTLSAARGKALPVYYVDLRSRPALQELKKGIEQKIAQPVLFIFDECLEEVEKVRAVHSFIEENSDNADLYCIYIYRASPAEAVKREEENNINGCFDNSFLELETHAEFFGKIAAGVKAAFKKIDSAELYNYTGGDLCILDVVLQVITSRTDFGKIKDNREELYKRVSDFYFKSWDGDFTAVQEMASLGQFDLGIEPAYYSGILDKTGAENQKLLTGLTAGMGQPARYYFLHGSLAELLCRAVSENEAGFLSGTAAKAAAYFKHLTAAGAGQENFDLDLGNFLYGRLKLSPDVEENDKIKIEFLECEEIIAFFKKDFDRISPGLMGDILLLLEKSARLNDYIQVLQEKIAAGAYIDTLAVSGHSAARKFLAFAGKSYPDIFAALKDQLNGEKIEQLSREMDFAGFIRFLGLFFKREDREAWQQMLENLDENSLAQLMDRTGADRFFMAELHTGLKELRTKGLLQHISGKVGTDGYLRLLEKNGTFFDLIRLLQHSPPSLTKALTDGLSSDLTGKLVERSITGRCPVNNFHRDLKLIKLLCGGFERKFEEKIGLENVLQLLLNNGSLKVLCALIDHFPPFEVSQLKLIEAFNVLTEEQKDEFLRAGDIFELCTAVVGCKRLGIFHRGDKILVKGKETLINELIGKSSFKNINRSLGCIENISNEELRTFMLTAVDDYMDNIGEKIIGHLPFPEKIAFLSILSRLDRLDKKRVEEVAAGLDEEDFLQEKDFLGTLQLLQHILTVHNAGPLLREEILTLANSDRVMDKLAKDTLLRAFLYLWNTYTLFLQGYPGDFGQWLNPHITDTILAIIEKYKRSKANAEATRHLLMLVGLLTYLAIEPDRLKRIFPRGKRLYLSKEFLNDILDRSTFITGFFYLRGIEFFVKKPLFPNKWKILTSKLYGLKVKTKGMRRVVESFFKRIKKKVPDRGK